MQVLVQVHTDIQPDAQREHHTQNGSTTSSLSSPSLTPRTPCPSHTPVQHLYIEFNRLRVLPPGPFWRQLRVLSMDWEPLLRCHTLLAQVGG